MEGTKTSTETKTNISRRGDLVTVKTTEITTVTAPGKDPKVTTKENEKKYSYEGKDGFDKLPSELRKSLEESTKVDGPINKKAARSDFEKKLLKEINKIRDDHHASSLKHCDKLSKYALERATEMAKKDEMVKKSNSDYGENVSCLWSSDPNHMVEDEEIAKRWYKEHEKYEYGKEPTVLSAGHFTQMVWKDCKHFGAAAVKSDSNKIYVVAAFDPPGNWTGEFVKNVAAPKNGVESFITSLIKRRNDSSSSSSSDDENGTQDLEKFNRVGVKAHNQLRKKHGVPDLSYSPQLAKYAQEWADKLAKSAKFEHRTESRYGENLYTFNSTSSKIPKASEAVDAWYSEIRDYIFGREPVSLKTGHFSQVVWKDSREVGMGICKGNRGWIIVANYNPPGNFRGSYTANVPPPK